MKTLEQLEKLSSNPFYVMTAEEKELLQNQQTESNTQIQPLKQDSKKKLSQSSGIVAVKETGRLDKQHGDPTSEL